MLLLKQKFTETTNGLEPKSRPSEPIDLLTTYPAEERIPNILHGLKLWKFGFLFLRDNIWLPAQVQLNIWPEI